MPVVEIQRRLMELGRIRLGEKGAKGQPVKLDTFRFTSASQALIEAAAGVYGGVPRAWQGAPSDGYYEVTTTSTSLPIVFPPMFSDRDGTPTLPLTQWLETWSAGGCQRRCDGVTESLTGKPCLCDKEPGEERTCQITTRLSFMLPELPGLGVWRLESKGWNAAVELPGTVEVLMLAAAERRFLPAVLRLEQRKSVKGGQTRKYVVPVIELPETRVGELIGVAQPLAISQAPTLPRERPALPAAEAPEPVAFNHDHEQGAEWGSAPEPETFADDGVTTLTVALTEKLQALGQDKAVEIIAKHRESHALKGHAAWLRAQIVRANDALAKSSEGTPSVDDLQGTGPPAGSESVASAGAVTPEPAAPSEQYPIPETAR